MPVDHKRINGPEATVPYRLFSKTNPKSLRQEFKDIEKNNVRIDNRKLDEHRKIYLKTGVVGKAKGSAYIELSNTKVIVSVFDPREIPNRNDYSLEGEIYCEFKYAPFSCPKRRLHQQDPEEKSSSAIMKKALESVVCRHEFPNFQVDIYALVLLNDGSAVSAAITAAGAALADAGIPMFDLVTSATLGIQGDITLLDPNLVEERISEVPIKSEQNMEGSHGVIILSILSTHEQISQFHQTGNLSLERINEGLKMLTKACQDIVPLVQKSLVQNVLKSVRED